MKKQIVFKIDPMIVALFPLPKNYKDKAVYCAVKQGAQEACYYDKNKDFLCNVKSKYTK